MPVDAFLDDRKMTILKAIIKTYLETGARGSGLFQVFGFKTQFCHHPQRDVEPGGDGLSYSPIHLRAIPSDKDTGFTGPIMLEKDSEVTELKEMMVQKVDKLELVLKKMAQVLASNTNYAAT